MGLVARRKNDSFFTQLVLPTWSLKCPTTSKIAILSGQPCHKYRRGYYQVPRRMPMQVHSRMAHTKYGGTHVHARYLKSTTSAILFGTKTNGTRIKRISGVLRCSNKQATLAQ